MRRKALFLLLGVSLLFEAYQTVMCFADLSWALKVFDVPMSDGARAIAHVVAWFLLLTTALIALAMRWIQKRRCEGSTLALVLGLFWIGIGIGIYAVSGITNNLILDSAKGALLIALILTQPKATSRNEALNPQS